MLMKRRSFLFGLGSLVAAPLVVRAENLMPVRSIERLLLPEYSFDSFDDHINLLDVRYQWVDADIKQAMVASGWSPVPVDRHNKEFRITGNTIEHGGCTLMQRTARDVVSSRAAEIQKARGLVSNWKQRFAEFNPKITRGGVPFDDPTRDWGSGASDLVATGSLPPKSRFP